MNDQAGQLSVQIEALLWDLANRSRVTDGAIAALRGVITSSPTLGRQIDTAISRGVLRRLGILEMSSNAGGEYHPAHNEIRFPSDLLADPAMTAFVLGHETQHALNSHTLDRAAERFQAAVRHAAMTTRDYTAAVRAMVNANRWDESSANLAGWNALVDHLRKPHGRLKLDRILRLARGIAVDFVDPDVTDQPRFRRGFTANQDLTLSLSPMNIETMARNFFDKPPDEAKLGRRGTSDYANYYGSWAVGIAVWNHNAINPGQPMRIDLAQLGLSRKLMEENGLALGIWQQRYVDGSTLARAQDILHDTHTTPRYVPFPLPVGLDGDPSTAALALATVSFAHAASEAIRTRTLRVPLTSRGLATADSQAIRGDRRSPHRDPAPIHPRSTTDARRN